MTTIDDTEDELVRTGFRAFFLLLNDLAKIADIPDDIGKMLLGHFKLISYNELMKLGYSPVQLDNLVKTVFEKMDQTSPGDYARELVETAKVIGMPNTDKLDEALGEMNKAEAQLNELKKEVEAEKVQEGTPLQVSEYTFYDGIKVMLRGYGNAMNTLDKSGAPEKITNVLTQVFKTCFCDAAAKYGVTLKEMNRLAVAALNEGTGIPQEVINKVCDDMFAAEEKEDEQNRN